ncbi:MAG: hypothetical protein P8P49_00230 [Opitutales bacterium]|nr:hypothetical protein [Opitutales bacterium]
MKNSIRLLFICINSMLFCLYSKAESGLLHMLPENTVFLLEVDDWKELSNSIESGPLGEFLESKAWEKMGEWTEQKMQSDSANSSEKVEFMFEQMEEWLDTVSGGVIMAVGNLEKLLSKKIPEVTLLIETEFTQEKLEGTLKWMKKEVTSSDGSFSWEREKIAGEDVHWIGPDNGKEKKERIAVVLINQTLGVFMGGEDHVRDTLLRVTGKSTTSSMVKNDNYLDLFDEIDRGSARMFIDFEQLQGLMEEAESVPNMQIPENPFGVTTSKLISVMGLDSLECFGMQIDPTDKKLDLSTAAFFSKYEGIFSFVQNEEKKEAVQYEFFPTQAFTATTARYDFARIWPTMEKIITGLSPQLLLLVNSQLQAFEEKAGVAFRRDVLGSLGDEVFSFSLLPGKIKSIEDFDKSSDFFGISLTDPKLFDRSLRTMIDSIASGNDLFSERVHKGVTIRKLRGLEESGSSLSYAVTEKWLLLAFGEDNQLNQVINRMQGKGNSLWKKKEIKQAMADLADDSSQLEYVDLEKLVSFLSSMATTTLELKGEFELKSSDFPNFPYFLIACSKNIQRGMVGKAKLYSKADQ